MKKIAPAFLILVIWIVSPCLATADIYMQYPRGSGSRVGKKVSAPTSTGVPSDKNGEEESASSASMDKPSNGDCGLYEKFLEKNSKEMMSGNPVSSEICNLYNQWFLLWTKGNCSTNSPKTYQALDCDSEK
jgi:hypothetical protein